MVDSMAFYLACCSGMLLEQSKVVQKVNCLALMKVEYWEIY